MDKFERGKHAKMGIYDDHWLCVDDDGIYIPDSYDSRCYRMLISEELFVEAYNKWIKGE